LFLGESRMTTEPVWVLKGQTAWNHSFQWK
jgi:hypothetical protein